MSAGLVLRGGDFFIARSWITEFLYNQIMVAKWVWWRAVILWGVAVMIIGCGDAEPVDESVSIETTTVEETRVIPRITPNYQASERYQTAIVALSQIPPPDADQVRGTAIAWLTENPVPTMQPYTSTIPPTIWPTWTPLPSLEYYFLPPRPDDLSDVEIYLERTLCGGHCPEYHVTVYGDGRVVYYGKHYVKNFWEHSYTIPLENIEALISLFYEYKFFSWQDEYTYFSLDNPTFTISIKIGHFRKTVFVDPPDEGPELFRSLADQIDELSGAKELVWGEDE